MNNNVEIGTPMINFDLQKSLSLRVINEDFYNYSEQKRVEKEAKVWR